MKSSDKEVKKSGLILKVEFEQELEDGTTIIDSYDPILENKRKNFMKEFRVDPAKQQGWDNMFK